MSKSSAAQGTLLPYDLKCEYLSNPLGVGLEHPRLSWKLRATAKAGDARGLTQSAYRIRVASTAAKVRQGAADLWDSGKVASAESLFIPYAGTTLRTGQRAWWQVDVWDQNGKMSTSSPPAFWERGIVDPAEWTGHWIGSHIVGGPKSEAPVPFLRKTFAVPKKTIRSARLYATALGLYEFRLNGQKVGEDVFAPFWTDYDKRVQYQVYDVTSLLKSNGENVAGAILGDGWYCGYTGNIQRRQYYGDRPRLLAQVVIEFTDGTTQTIATDGSWSTATGPILYSDMMMGENYDARLEFAGWDRAGFSADDRWTPAVTFPAPSAPIVAMAGPPVRAIQELKPAPLKPRTNPWREVVDFKQNLVGRVRLKVKGNAGTTIMLRFAEMLDKDGNVYTVNLRSAKQTDYYILRGDPKGEIFESRFTFHGFRYVEVAGYPGDLTPDSLTAIVLHTDMAPTGTFTCSDPLVNQLQKNIQWGQRGNFVDVPTDCPQRDERLGWTGDAQAFARTASFNFNVAGFFAKWTQDLRDAQSPLGSYPCVAPRNEKPRLPDDVEHISDGGPAWADAGVICPWTAWQSFGDARMIENHWHSMTKYVDRLHATSKPFGLIRAHPDWKGWHGYGDWLSQDGKDGLFGSTPRDLIGTAFFAYCAKLVAQIGTALGKTEEAARYAKLAAQVTKAFQRRFVTDEGLLVGNTQTAYVLALHFDLLPAALRPKAVKELVRNIKNNGNRLNTGFVGTPYLNHVLTENGHLDVAYTLLVQKNWPSWLYSVTQGATTIWERWDGWTHDKGFQDPGMNSFNHYAYGAIGDWLYRRVAGIELDPARPGYRHVVLQPHPLVGGPLTHATAALETPCGPLRSGWKLHGKELSYHVSLPPNTSATLQLPAGATNVKEGGTSVQKVKGIKAVQGGKVLEIGSGDYEFTLQLA